MSTHSAAWNDAHRNRLMIAKAVDPRLGAFVHAHYSVDDAPRFLDVGCGTGLNARWLARNGFEVDAIDTSPVAIMRAKEIERERVGRAVKWQIACATNLPFRDCEFDAAIDICVLENLDRGEVVRAMNEIRRTLKIGGRLFSLTASDGRDDSLTECGYVRKPGRTEMSFLLDVAGFAGWSMERQTHRDERGRKVENWRIEAVR